MKNHYAMSAFEICDMQDKNEEMVELLKRIYQWDMMDFASDGKFWRKEIDKVLGQTNE